MSRLITLRFTPDDRQEVLGSLACALRCMAEASMLSITPGEVPQIAAHRRCLTRLYWELSGGTLRSWEEQQEKEISLLLRVKCLLRIFAARLLGMERQGVERTARQLAALIEERERGDRLWDDHPQA